MSQPTRWVGPPPYRNIFTLAREGKPPLVLSSGFSRLSSAPSPTAEFVRKTAGGPVIAVDDWEPRSSKGQTFAGSPRSQSLRCWIVGILPGAMIGGNGQTNPSHSSVPKVLPHGDSRLGDERQGGTVATCTV